MKILTMLPVAILVVLITSFSSFAETLTVDTGAQVAPGASGVTVDINIDDGSNTAGVFLTIEYDTTKLTLTDVSSSFFGTFASQNISPTSITVETDTYTQAMVSNLTTGGTMLSATRTSNGEAGPQTLFTLTFDVAGDATGDYPIDIVSSIIENAAAGYSTPTPLPMLVTINNATNPVSYPSIIPFITSGTLAVVDTDGDGLSDEAELIMGTDPNLADSDGDGLSDGEEFTYWGNNWNADNDNDGLINILDDDADNDGYLDGNEVPWGSDPGNPDYLPVHVYEDAEDGTINGWTINDVDPAGATVSNVFDDVRESRVIELTGDGIKDQFILRKDNGTDWKDADFKVIQWSMKYDQTFTVAILVKTLNGNRVLQYRPVDTDNLGTDTYIHHGLGSQIKDGNWHTLIRDLEYDLKEAQPDNELLEVLNFRVRGSGRVDDILTSVAIPETQDSDGDNIIDNMEIYSYTTHPYHADSDGDGLNDGDELAYWGNDWNLDPDNDDQINILDDDADNDGYIDGDELSVGTEPDDPASFPHVYEEAEDETVNGWDIVDADPPGATISNVFDDVRQSRVIEVNGDGKNNTYRLRNDDGTNWLDADFKVMQWSMRYDEGFTVVVVVKTSQGNRNLTYSPVNFDNLGTNVVIHHGLGSQIIDGNWHTLTRDLEHDLKEAQPDIELLEVLHFRIRGSGRIDDIMTLPAIPALRDSDGDTITDNEEIYTYGTHPYHADSDSDGLNDGEELAYWGSIWNLDLDTDGLFNLVDDDADNDGYLDGEEVSVGTDPGDLTSFPHVYEDAEDENINGWAITDNDPAGADVSNVFDDVLQSRVIELTADGRKNAFSLGDDVGSNWRDADYKVMQWSMQSDMSFTVTINVKTLNGNVSLTYTPGDIDNLGTGITVHHGLGSQLKDGNWHTLTRDLEYDLKEAQPDNEVIQVQRFRVRGSGRVDDIRTIGIVPANP